MYSLNATLGYTWPTAIYNFGVKVSHYTSWGMSMIDCTYLLRRKNSLSLNWFSTTGPPQLEWDARPTSLVIYCWCEGFPCCTRDDHDRSHLTRYIDLTVPPESPILTRVETAIHICKVSVTVKVAVLVIQAKSKFKSLNRC